MKTKFGQDITLPQFHLFSATQNDSQFQWWSTSHLKFQKVYEHVMSSVFDNCSNIDPIQAFDLE